VALETGSHDDPWGDEARARARENRRFLLGFCGCGAVALFLVVATGGGLGYASYALNMARTAAREHHDREAVDWYDRTLASPLGNVYAYEARLERADAKARLQDFAGASDDLGTCIDMKPELAEPYAERARCRIKLLDSAGALDDATHAIERSGAAPEFLSLRARVRENMGDVPGAIADAEACLAKNPKSYEAHYYRAMARSDRGDAAGCQEDFDVLVREHPRVARLLDARAREKALAGDRVGAVADLANAAALAPQDHYVALWSWAIGGEDKPVATARLTGGWTDHLVRFYRGDETREAVLAEAARGSDDRERRERFCEAWAYFALADEREGKLDEARVEYEKSFATGVANFIEYGWAKRRLAIMRKAEKR